MSDLASPKRRVDLGTAHDIFVLDTAFALFEGHPPFRNGKGKHRSQATRLGR